MLCVTVCCFILRGCLCHSLALRVCCSQELVRLSIRCSIVGLAAEVRLCKTVSDRTQGELCFSAESGHFFLPTLGPL